MQDVYGASVGLDGSVYRSIFTGSLSTDTSNTATWEKPLGVQWVFIFMVGAGGNGGNGFTGAGGGGGAGGASGAMATLFVPAMLIPDRLLVRAGCPNTATFDDPIGTSTVQVNRGLTAPDILLSAGGGGVGGNGTSGAKGFGDNGGQDTVAESASVYSKLGVAKWFIGLLGGHGGVPSGTAAVNVVAFVSGVVGAGAGGAANGSALSGGSVLAGGPFSLLSGGAPGQPGLSGFHLEAPWCSTGGSGGGSATAGAGGRGGNGTYGSGGGGGGAGSTAGGTGGRGGPGYILIVSG